MKEAFIKLFAKINNVFSSIYINIFKYLFFSIIMYLICSIVNYLNVTAIINLLLKIIIGVASYGIMLVMSKDEFTYSIFKKFRLMK